MSVPCPVCAAPTTDGTVCLHCGSISPAPVVDGPPAVLAAPVLLPPPPPPGAAPAGMPAAPVPGAPAVAAVPVVPTVAGGAVLGADGSVLVPAPVAIPADGVPPPAAPGVVPVLTPAGVGGAVAVPVDAAGTPLAEPGAVVAPGPLAPAALVVPPGASGPVPVAVLPVVPVPSTAGSAGRAVAWGVLAAVLISAAWVGGYLWSDRNQEVGRPVTAGQDAAPSIPPTSFDPGTPLPTDGTDPTASADQGDFSGQDTPSSTPPTVPILPVPVSGQATCDAPPGVDAAGAPQTYEVARAYDGLLDTAWRCTGDASGQSVTFDLGQPVLLTSVGLVPGFDKIDPVDGSDRFVQGRTVIRARWVFDDGSAVDVTPNGVRGMQTVPVQVTTQTVQLQILETRPGSTITDNTGTQWAAVDATAVSEVAFEGLTY